MPGPAQGAHGSPTPSPGTVYHPLLLFQTPEAQAVMMPCPTHTWHLFFVPDAQLAQLGTMPGPAQGAQVSFDMPFKENASSTLPFLTFSRYCNTIIHTMGQEIKGYMISPMPVKKFINMFFLKDKIPGYFPVVCSNGRLKATVNAKKGEEAYGPFVSTTLSTSLPTLISTVRPKQWLCFPPGYVLWTLTAVLIPTTVACSH